MTGLTHIGPDGRAVMVDVSAKADTERTAIAVGHIDMSTDAFAQATNRNTKKGDPLAIAELAGIMAAKKTADLVPLCHPLPLTKIKVEITPDDNEPITHSGERQNHWKNRCRDGSPDSRERGLPNALRHAQSD